MDEDFGPWHSLSHSRLDLLGDGMRLNQRQSAIHFDMHLYEATRTGQTRSQIMDPLHTRNSCGDLFNLGT